MKPANISPGRAQVRQALTIYLAVLVGLFTLACLVTGVRRELFGEHYPFDTFLYDPNVRFSDLLIFNERLAVIGKGTAFFDAPGHPFPYPAPCAYAYLLFVRFSDPVLTYLLVFGSAVLTGAVVVVRAARAPIEDRGFVRAVVIVTTFFSYPFLMLIDRANIEGLVWILLFLGLVAFVRERFFLAATFLGVAAAMKIFPVVLFLLFVPRRRYEELAAAAGVAAAVTLAALIGIGPTLPQAARGIASGLTYLGRHHALQIRPGELNFEHSLFSSLKWAAWLDHHDVERVNRELATYYPAYGVLVVVGFVGLYLVRLRKLPVTNQLFALVVCMITLPFISQDYTLTHLYLPWGVLVITMVRDMELQPLPLRHAIAFLVPCAVVFSPQSYLLVGTMGWGGQVKVVALLALLWAAARIPLPSSLFGERA